jgi:2-dehydro-3-deoxyphosphogluconate aldolase/(4S)-4-hydroxy-2-oxoglutarate aldolase
MSPPGYESVIECITGSRIIPVLRSKHPADAIELLRAFTDAGLGAIELTTSIPDWQTVLSEAQRLEGHDVCVGLGTVTSSETARQAVDLGAGFIVSPMFIPDVISQCRAMGIPVIPGVLTPTEAHQAVSAGAEILKVFPVSAVGGPSYIKALLAPMPELKLIPTGGVKPENAIDYLRAGAVAVGMGSNIAPREALDAKDWHAVKTAVADLLASINIALGEKT